MRRLERASWEVPHNGGVAGCPLRLFSNWSNQRPRSGTSLCGCYSSYPSGVVLLGLCGPGVVSASPPGSGIFTVMSSCLWLVATIVDLLVRGAEIRNKLCFHLNEVTSRGSWTVSKRGWSWFTGQFRVYRLDSLLPGPLAYGAADRTKAKRGCTWAFRGMDHSQQVNYLGASPAFSKWVSSALNCTWFHRLLPGSQSSHKDFRSERDAKLLLLRRAMSKRCFIRPSYRCLSLYLLICLSHYFCFL